MEMQQNGVTEPTDKQIGEGINDKFVCRDLTTKADGICFV